MLNLSKSPFNILISSNNASGESVIPFELDKMSDRQTVIEPIDRAVVPPSELHFSVTIIFAPSSEAETAAERPAPPPIIKISFHLHSSLRDVFLRSSL